MRNLNDQQQGIPRLTALVDEGKIPAALADLKRQDSEGRTVGHRIFARDGCCRTLPYFTLLHTLVDKGQSSEVIAHLKQQTRGGWTVGHLIAAFYQEYDAEVTQEYQEYLKLLKALLNQGQGLEVWSILNLKTEPDVIYNGDGDLFTFEPPKIIVNSAGNNGAFVIFNQPYRTIVSFFTFLEELSRCAAKAPMLRKHCLSDMARYVGRTGERALTVAPRYVGLKEKLFEKIQELPGEEERAYWIWCALRAKNSSLYQIYHTARGFFSPGENREGTALFKLKQSLKGSSYARMLDQPFTGEGMPSFEVFQTMAHKPPAQSAVDNRFSLFAFIRGLKRTPPLSNNEKISERPYSNGAL